MAYTTLASTTWGTASPTINVEFAYQAARSGANMVYDVRVTVKALPSTGGRYFGYPIYCDILLDSNTVDSGHTLKNASPSNWTSDIVYTPQFSIQKTSGETQLGIKLYSGMGSSRSQSYSYSLPVTATASTISATLNWTVGVSGTVSITKQDAAFRDWVRYTVGNISGTVGNADYNTGTSATFSWTPPISLLNQMVGKEYVIVTFKTNTYMLDGTLIGTNSTQGFLYPAGSVYRYPVVSVSYKRGTGTGSGFSPSDTGANIKLTVKVTLGSLVTANLVTKLDGSTVSGASATGISGGTYNYYLANVDNQVTHTIVCTVTDDLGNTGAKSVQVNTISVPMNIHPALPAVAFGKLAETAKSVDLADDWSLRKNNVDVDLCIGRGYDSTNKWYWRKWSSGICELWGNQTDTPSTSTQISGTGSTFYSDQLSHTLPFNVSDAVVTGSCNHSGYITASSVSSSTLVYRIARGTDITSESYTVRLHIIGRWTTFTAS